MKNFLAQLLKALLCPLAVYLFFTVASGGNFGKPAGIFILLQQSIIPGVMAWGITFNLTVGSFDFSIGGATLLTSIIAARVENAYGFLPMIIACLAFGTLTGCINGAIFAFMRIPSLIVTLAMLLIYESAGILVSGSMGLMISRDSMILGRMPWLLLLAAFVGGLCYLLLNRTKFGCGVQAIGNDPLIAQNIGLNFRRTKFMCFMTVGLFIGFAAIVKLGYGGNAWPMYGMSSMTQVFQAMMAFHIGRYIRKFSGLNLPLAVFFGAFVMTMISTGMISIGVPGSFQNTVIGCFMLVFIVLAENGKKFSFGSKAFAGGLSGRKRQ